MKNYITFIKESIDEYGMPIDNMTVYYDEFCDIYFSGNKSKFLDWLNMNCSHKKVIFIAKDDRFIDNGGAYFTTKEFAFNSNNEIRVDMTNGQNGIAKGLIFIDTIILPDPKIKYIRNKNTEIDPFEEEDWGYTIIDPDDV